MIYAASGKAEALAQQQAQAAQSAQDSAKQSEGREFGFNDLLDVINPLQHIPIVSTLYRDATGDEISGPARMAGGTLYGGPVGFVVSAFDTIMAAGSGKDMGEQAMAAVFGDDGATTAAPTTAVADAGTNNVGAASARPTADEATANAIAASGRTGGTAGGDGNAASEQPGQEGGGGAPLTGNAALAAFARDMGGGAGDQAADAAARQQAANAEAQDRAGERTQQASAAIGRDSDYEFMRLRQSDYNYSATLRSRMQAARNLMPDEARHPELNGRTPQHPATGNDTSGSQTSQPATNQPAANQPDAGDSGPTRSSAAPATAAAQPPLPEGAPADLAQRMKQALEKYRTMHENQ